jgi:hypothetical protein
LSQRNLYFFSYQQTLTSSEDYELPWNQILADGWKLLSDDEINEYLGRMILRKRHPFPYAEGAFVDFHILSKCFNGTETITYLTIDKTLPRNLTTNPEVNHNIEDHEKDEKGNDVKFFTRDFNRWFERIIREGTYTDIFVFLFIDDSETKKKSLNWHSRKITPKAYAY